MELIRQYPGLKMIAGMNEYSSVGAARAVKAAGAENKIQVVGVDSSQEAVQLMEHGIFQGIVVQKAFKMGYLGVQETVRLLRGETYEAEINSGCQLVTPENMYTSEIEKLLFPFNTLKTTKQTAIHSEIWGYQSRKKVKYLHYRKYFTFFVRYSITIIRFSRYYKLRKHRECENSRRVKKLEKLKQNPIIKSSA